MKSIFALIYTSRAVSEITEALIQDLLQTSLKRNKRDGITGFLIARQGFFLQLIEGDESKVRALYKDIQADRRHKGLVLQGEILTETRMMPDWTMGLIPNDGIFEKAESILALFELGRAGEIYADRESLETILRIFARGAQPVPVKSPRA